MITIPQLPIEASMKMLRSLPERFTSKVAFQSGITVLISGFSSLIADHLPEPDLLIYLIAPPEILQKRIADRGRAMESGISLEYLQLLDSFYEDWMSTFNLCPVLKIRSDDLDFVNKKDHLDTVANLVQEKLTGKEEIVF